MVDLFCDNADCLFCDPNDYFCTAQVVQIDCCGECKTYEEYESHEPKELYWKRCFYPKTRTIQRKAAYGYRIVVDGVTFFTDADSRYKDCHRYVTEGKSGVLCGTLADAKEDISYIKKMIPTFGNVFDYPEDRDFAPSGEENDNG
jgi:hypothetical protein